VGSGEPVTAVDAFDLPEWLGVGEVTWTARSSVTGGHRVVGELSVGPEALGCDLLAADLAFPQATLGESWRHDAHQAWSFGEVLLVEHESRLTLAVPGTSFTADRVLEALTRLAKAIGVRPDRFVAALRL
jgi:hypothetical protein